MNWSDLYEKLMSTHAFLPYYFGRGVSLSPMRVQVELTGRCNLKCNFCYQGEDYRIGADELSFSEIISIIDQIPRHSLLTLSGGEPLLKDRIEDILNYALKKHYCNIITNGVLLSRDISRLMVNKKLILINISIDGIGDILDELRGVRGTFMKIRENILFLKEYKRKQKINFPLIDVKTLVTKKNISQLFDLYKFCEEIEANFLTISLPKNNDIQFNGTKLFDDLNNSIFYRDYPLNLDFDFAKFSQILEIINKNERKVKIRFYPRFEDYRLMEDYFIDNSEKRHFYSASCTEPWSGFQINAKGKAYPCLAYCVGDTREQGIKHIWNSLRFINFRKKLKKIKLFPGCSCCCYLKIRRKK